MSILDISPNSMGAAVGFIGLGAMGAPMAMNVLVSNATIRLSVFNRSRGRASELLDRGAVWAENPRELALASKVIVIMLPDLPELEEILQGPEGLIAGVSQPTVLVVSSTSSAEGIRALSESLDRETGGLLHVIDAPVSGGEEGAIAGTLSIMVGGKIDDVRVALPVLEAMGSPRHLGSLGSGEVAKYCNQLIVAATILALGEAAVLADRSGIDLTDLFDLLGGGYAASRILETRKRRLIVGDYTPSGIAKYMVKDLTLAASEAEASGTAAAQLDFLLKVFSDLVEKGFGEQDISVTRAYTESLSTPSPSADS